MIAFVYCSRKKYFGGSGAEPTDDYGFNQELCGFTISRALL